MSIGGIRCGSEAFEQPSGSTNHAGQTPVGRSKGIFVQKCYHVVVVGIGEIVDELIQGLLKSGCRSAGKNRKLAQTFHHLLLLFLKHKETLQHGDSIGRIHISHMYFLKDKSTRHFATGNTAEKFHQTIELELRGVSCGLICEKDTQWQKNCRTKPYSFPYGHFTVAGHFVAGVVDYIVDNEEKHGNNQRSTEAALDRKSVV